MSPKYLPPFQARGCTAAALCALLMCAAVAAAAPPSPAAAKKPVTAAEVLAASTSADWRALDPQNTLYMELPGGRVVIELAPQFAPHHVANVLTLVRGGYFDGIPIVRAQDNYVVQWGDPEGKKPVGAAQRSVAAEFERPLRGLTIT
ncbi:MAG TPA: peptidylprolyl isomerase, partial [Longimicrobiales bacterium]